MTEYYHGVYGLNGIGVYTDHIRFEIDTQIYVREPRSERFSSFHEAFRYAVDGFEDLRNDSAPLPDEGVFKLNYFYYYRKPYRPYRKKYRRRK